MEILNAEEKQQMEQKRREHRRLAADILEWVRKELLVGRRFFGRAIFALEPLPSEEAEGFAVDGRFLYYAPEYVIRLFRQEKERLRREYLHVLLHCLFRHFDVGPDVDRQLWDLACDIAAENLIRELDVPRTQIPEERAQGDVIARLAERMSLLSAEKIYHELSGEDRSMADELLSAAGACAFLRDDHRLWYGPAGQAQTGQEEIRAAVWDDLDVTMPDQVRVIPKVELAELWKKIADITSVELESDAQNRGSRAGSLSRQLRLAGRDRVDYRLFLQKFAALREDQRLDPDGFDYVYYTYGLSLYGDMPLIEPLESREDRRIREFAIAIDTSGSVSQETVRRFLESTAKILRTQETFLSKVVIYIIQCDAQIRHVAVIRSEEELDRYLGDLTVFGYGGTDFRPVFSYIDRLKEEGGIGELDGLLYFTDGLGTYPERPAAYRTAFIFTDEGMELQSDFPVWAMRIVLSEEEIAALD